jgi:biofilm PGA synthesis N-glycosyltransferase PgaC
MIVFIFQIVTGNAIESPILWMGNYLAIVCLFQFFVALYIERKYEPNILSFLAWAVWYPILYWHINALLVIFAFPKAFRVLSKNRNQYATWLSPDRGISNTEKKEVS